MKQIETKVIELELIHVHHQIIKCQRLNQHHKAIHYEERKLKLIGEISNNTKSQYIISPTNWMHNKTLSSLTLQSNRLPFDSEAMDEHFHNYCEKSKAFLKKVNPVDVHEIMAVYCLGGRDEDSKIQYISNQGIIADSHPIHPFITWILSPTNGVLVYREQLIEIIQCCSGWGYAESDALRKVIGMKKNAEMQLGFYKFQRACLQQEAFVMACQKYDLNIEQTVKSIIHLIHDRTVFLFQYPYVMAQVLLAIQLHFNPTKP